ncbi:ABC transporter ATP-binding protein [Agrobacterium vitis]|uniref:ABC transporter ATP-binding protein n=1 Tax=Agrobacterium vitis TaxID=373 RepID=UPI0008DC2AE7|nr:ABC transporter ATP-binding protein [Agrobacterium vitis]MUO31034.1 ATP-binding cassette domain-containing protein [Agrobacterium vitis]
MSQVLVDNVSVEFGRHREAAQIALANTNLTIEQGEFICLLGPSGCGKSTLLNVVGGLVEATTGQVVVEGKSVAHPGPDRGMVFQNYSLYPWLTVRGNVEFGPRLNGWSASKVSKIADELIEIVGLTDYAQQYPKVLSGGMRQRVAIARALAMEPHVLLMDEPFAALDAQTRSRMQELLLEIWARKKSTVVFVTHDIEEAIFLADRVLVMSARPGRIIEDFKIELPRPRSADVVASDEFTQYRKRMLHLLRH